MSEKDPTVSAWVPVPETEGLWTATCQADGVPGGVNVVLVAGSDGCALVDVGATPEQGAALRRSAEELTGVPLACVVLTHHHWDHVGGLPAFDGVPVLGHRSVPGVTDGFSLVSAKDLGGGVSLEAMVAAPAHTAGDVVVYVPHARVLVAGDLVEQSGLPQLDEDSTLTGWIKAYRLIAPVLVPGTRVVPGHGEIVEREFFAEQAADLGDIEAQCTQLLDRGVSDAERALPLGTWPWPDGPELAGAVAAGMRDLRAAGKRPQLGLRQV